MPCNQFGGQEPGTVTQVCSFADRKGAKFPIFDKIEVNGPQTHPLYKFLKDTAPSSIATSLLGKDVKWNFAKYLVDGNGKVVNSYQPTSSPLSLEGDITNLLK